MAAEAEGAIEEEQQDEECPKCPPVGAPAWMATFADMATLLMAFFVLILSFAEFNVPKFKQISGSLKNAFGVQRIIPIVEQPKGTTILSLNFSPSPSPSLTDDMTQQTTDVTKPDLDLQQKSNDGEGMDGSADDILKALETAIARGDIEVETLGEKVVVNFTATDTEQQNLPQMLKETLNALEAAKQSGGKADQEVLFGGLEQKLKQMIAATEQAQQQQAEIAQAATEAKEKSENANRRAEIAEDELRVALKQQIDQGLVDVERTDDKVIITVGSGGAFPSGSAALTPQAKQIMEKIAGASADSKGKIKVSGHTDNVPLVFGSNFRDNWDLAAARSASVVQALEDTGAVSAGRLEAISFGETQPLESNDTAEGRNKNRRIEIEINY
ncbi:MAG: flagellar motor protein MotB [Alphaproteobacteria bacterium]|nr:flagellar motor protein MotB [Alphaproteobacteria bacterium]